MISLIVAASRNNVIAAAGVMPWRLSADLVRFKALTLGKPVIMGRLTNESIGRALPGRRNIVVTRQQGYSMPGCETVDSPQAALEVAGGTGEIMVIGGGEIYRQFLPKAECIYLTRVLADIPGDVYFPELDPAQWLLLSCEAHAADDRNDFETVFKVLQRKPQGSST